MKIISNVVRFFALCGLVPTVIVLAVLIGASNGIAGGLAPIGAALTRTMLRLLGIDVPNEP